MDTANELPLPVIVKKTRKPRTPKPKKDVISKDPYKYPLVELQWVDAESDHGWEDDKDTEAKVPMATTVGFLIKETDEVLVVASTYESDTTNARMKIPRVWLKSFKTLHLKEE